VKHRAHFQALFRGPRQAAWALACLALLVLTSLPADAAPAAAADSGPRADSALRAANASLLRDIEAARRELQALQDRVRTERVKAVTGSEALRREVRELQEKLGGCERTAGEAVTRLDAAKSDAARLASTVEFVDNLFTEYRRAFETRLSVAGRQECDAALRAVDQRLGPGTAAERLHVAGELLDLARRHADAEFGGRTFDGQAQDERGTVLSGRFAEAGPVAYFVATAATGPAGIVVQPIGSLTPQVLAVLPGGVDTSGVRRLVRDGQGTVPVDATLGTAVKLRQVDETWVEHVRKGGIVMVPLLLMGVVCAVLALYKFASLLTVGSRGSEARIAAILDALRQDRDDEALALARRLPRPLGPVLIEGINHRRAPKEHVEEIMYERLLSTMPALERLLAPLAVCASSAPLLGLLGTVTGMIRTFKLITVFGTGDAKLLSSGISEALITTQYGLYIAVPALLVHAYLSRRVRKAVAMTQQSAVMFVNGLKLRGVPGNGDVGPPDPERL
jgi:biopolymer transport protein ExbB